MDHFMRDEQRYRNKEHEIFEKIEDLLDDEHIRKTVEQVDNAVNSLFSDIFSGVLKPKADSSINKRDEQIAKEKLPEVGSFSLIKDLVRDYTDLSVK